jgi:hypothetical protein
LVREPAAFPSVAGWEGRGGAVPVESRTSLPPAFRGTAGQSRTSPPSGASHPAAAADPAPAAVAGPSPPPARACRRRPSPLRALLRCAAGWARCGLGRCRITIQKYPSRIKLIILQPMERKSRPGKGGNKEEPHRVVTFSMPGPMLLAQANGTWGINPATDR